MKKRIVIFASGNGTNAQNIIEYFKNSPTTEVVLVLSNKKDAKVLERAKNQNINCLSFDKDALYSEDGVLQILKDNKVDLIVLAGFLWKFPELIIEAYPDQIINIHPALLPKYGGKGMYGMHVHRAVVAANENESGITIHYVNANYDEGAIVFQARTKLVKDDTPEDVARKVQELEHDHFPRVIEELLHG